MYDNFDFINEQINSTREKLKIITDLYEICRKNKLEKEQEKIKNLVLEYQNRIEQLSKTIK